MFTREKGFVLVAGLWDWGCWKALIRKTRVHACAYKARFWCLRELTGRTLRRRDLIRFPDPFVPPVSSSQSADRCHGRILITMALTAWHKPALTHWLRQCYRQPNKLYSSTTGLQVSVKLLNTPAQDQHSLNLNWLKNFYIHFLI